MGRAPAKGRGECRRNRRRSRSERGYSVGPQATYSAGKNQMDTMTNETSGFDLVLKGGRVIDERNKLDGNFDVAVKGGKIARVAADIAPMGAKVRDVRGAIVAPGL